MNLDKESYSTRIIPFLYILGGFEPPKIQKIEGELIQYLESKGLSPWRYRRYKTDRDNQVPLYHQEVEALIAFFKSRFDQMIKKTDDQRMKETLMTWQPQTSADLYTNMQASAV